MPRLFGSKMKYKKSLVRNIKRAGGVSTVGRSVYIASGSRCQCDNAVWCPLTNGRGFKLTAPKDCNVFIKSIDSILIGGKVEVDGLAKAGEVITINFTANQRLNTAKTTVSFTFGGTAATGVFLPLSETNGRTFRYKITYTVAAGENGDLSFTITPVAAARIGKNPTSAAVTLTADRNGNTVTADTTLVNISSTSWTFGGAAAAGPFRSAGTDYVIAKAGVAAVATVKFSEILSANPVLDADDTHGSGTGTITGAVVAGTPRDYTFSFTTTEATAGANDDTTVSSFSFTGVTDLAGNTTNIVAGSAVELIVDNEQPQFTIQAQENMAVVGTMVNRANNGNTGAATTAGRVITFTLTLNAGDYSALRTAAKAQLMQTGGVTAAHVVVTRKIGAGGAVTTLANNTAAAANGAYTRTAATDANNGPFTFTYQCDGTEVAGSTVTFTHTVGATNSFSGVPSLIGAHAAGAGGGTGTYTITFV